MQIRGWLISSAFAPGYKLILRPLAATLGLSPTPVREALFRLVSEQALVLDERGSAVVPVVTRAGFRELIQMRGALEARAAERMAATCTEQQVDELDRTNERYLRLVQNGDFMEALEADLAFHDSICLAGQSPLILRMLEGLWTRLGPVYALSLEQPPPEPGPDGHPHVQLIAALRRRDVHAADAAALADVAYGNESIEPNLPDDRT